MNYSLFAEDEYALEQKWILATFIRMWPWFNDYTFNVKYDDNLRGYWLTVSHDIDDKRYGFRIAIRKVEAQQRNVNALRRNIDSTIRSWNKKVYGG